MVSSHSAFLKLAVAIMVCMALTAPLAEAAMTCGTVTKGLAPCMGYLRSGGSPSAACCNGVRSIKGMAATKADRQVACNCLKSAASRVSGIKLNNAASLPGKCGVSVSLPISPRTDCSRVG
ncbi:Non-specific lipid-transfer protein-like protein [Drosera capensis]